MTIDWNNLESNAPLGAIVIDSNTVRIDVAKLVGYEVNGAIEISTFFAKFFELCHQAQKLNNQTSNNKINSFSPVISGTEYFNEKLQKRVLEKSYSATLAFEVAPEALLIPDPP